MATPSLGAIFGFDVFQVFELVAFLIFVYLVVQNAGAFSTLLTVGGNTSVNAIKALQGR